MRFGVAVSMGIASWAWSVAIPATTIVNETGVIPCGPKVQCLCDAAAIKDKSEREGALLRLLGEGLESVDHEVRDQTFHYLAQVESIIDPRLLRSSLERFDELEEDTGGRLMVERLDFRAASKGVHLNAYYRAIAEGEAQIGTVTTISRSTAMDAAAREGFGELRGLIVSVTQGWPTESIERILVRLDLRDGAENEVDGDLRAARRLEMIPAAELKGKLEKSHAWREIVGDIARAACRQDDSQACGVIKGVIKRQRDLVSAERKRIVASWDFKSAPIPRFPETIEVLSEWMRGLP